MDRRSAVGIGLVVISAAGYGSGSILAAPIYSTGVDWLTLVSWRFLVGAVLGWLWVLASSHRRAALRRLGRRQLAVALASGCAVRGELRDLLREPRDGPRGVGGRHRLHLSRHGRGPVAALRDPPAGQAPVDRGRARGRRVGARAGRHRRRRGATGQRAPARVRLGHDLLGLDHPLGAPVGRAPRPPGKRVDRGWVAGRRCRRDDDA